MNNVAPVIKEIADSCGIDQKNVSINDLYLQWVLQPSYEMIMVCGTLILGIVLFSVVVIYNIFHQAVVSHIFFPSETASVFLYSLPFISLSLIHIFWNVVTATHLATAFVVFCFRHFPALR